MEACSRASQAQAPRPMMMMGFNGGFGADSLHVERALGYKEQRKSVQLAMCCCDSQALAPWQDNTGAFAAIHATADTLQVNTTFLPSLPCARRSLQLTPGASVPRLSTLLQAFPPRCTLLSDLEHHPINHHCFTPLLITPLLSFSLTWKPSSFLQHLCHFHCCLSFPAWHSLSMLFQTDS